MEQRTLLKYAIRYRVRLPSTRSSSSSSRFAEVKQECSLGEKRERLTSVGCRRRVRRDKGLIEMYHSVSGTGSVNSFFLILFSFCRGFFVFECWTTVIHDKILGLETPFSSTSVFNQPLQSPTFNLQHPSIFSDASFSFQDQQPFLSL